MEMNQLEREDGHFQALATPAAPVTDIDSQDHLRKTPTITAGGPSANASTQPSNYVTQFPSSSSLILNRLRVYSQPLEGNSQPSEAGQNMGATLSLPTTSQQAQSITTATPNTTDSLNTGVKRKGEFKDDVDFTQNTISFPKTDALSYPATTAQVAVQTGRCTICDNAMDAAESASTKSCAYCAAEQEQSTSVKGKFGHQRQQEVDRLRHTRLDALPKNVIPAKPHLVGFGAGRASGSSRTEYFDGVKKTDLLNILSFCDQLKPNLLVDILVSVSKRHPSLPIFDSPDWEAQLSSTRLPHKSSRPDKPRHGHMVLPSKVKPRQKTTKKILKRTRVIEVITTAPEEDEDVLPPTWARANEGSYSLLSPETEDKLLLVDENDEESFSHFMVDGFGKQIM